MYLRRQSRGFGKWAATQEGIRRPGASDGDEFRSEKKQVWKVYRPHTSTTDAVSGHWILYNPGWDCGFQ